MIADILTPRERPIFQSYSSVMFMAAIDPRAARRRLPHRLPALVVHLLDQLPLGVVALAMTDRALKLIPRNDRPHKLDVIGAAVMVVAAVLLLLALSWGGVRYPWGSFEVIALLVASALLWLAFARRLATAPEPFIPLSMIREPLIGADGRRRLLLDRHHHRALDRGAALSRARARLLGDGAAASR